MICEYTVETAIPQTVAPVKENSGVKFKNLDKSLKKP